MDVLTIYNPDGFKLLDACLDSSTQDWAIMSENRLQAEFYSEECILLPSGCYVDFDGRRFWLLDEYKPTLESRLEYAYNVKFVGVESLLSVTLMLKTTDGEDNPIFPLTAPAVQHLQLIVANLQRRFPDIPWHVGDVIETENIYIEYAGTYCADAIQQIVSGRDVEWWVDDEYGINVGRCELGDLVELGYQKGLIGGITHSLANNLRSYAYLCPIGSTRNISPEKYGHDRLQLPDGITLIPMNPDQGVAELAEANAFAGIYPRYIGEVTAIRTKEGNNEDGSKFTIYFIEDAAIPFNPNEYELPGKVKNITFQSGELMGAEFEVNYDEISHEFEIITQWPRGGAQLPGGFLVPAVGDKYVVWNISMPDEYYPLAEEEFLAAAQKFAQDSVKDASVYRAPVDYIDVQERGLTLRPGQRVRLLSAEYFPSTGYYDSRITRIIRDIRYPNEITVEISTVRAEGTIARLQNAIQQTETQLKQVEQSVGEMPAIITSTSVAQPTDSNVYSALRSDREFLSKEKGGTVKKKVNFAEGIQLFGRDLFCYDAEKDAWELNGNLVVTGGMAFFSKLEGFEKKTITQAINCDGVTIHINDAGQLEVIGGAGSLDEEELAQYLSDNKYIQKLDLDKRFTKTEIQKALGIYDWALAESKPTYKYSEIQDTPLKYNAETDAWELYGNLVVTGGMAFFTKLEGFEGLDLTSSLNVDGTTISNEGGILKVIGGTGGGLDESALAEYLTTNKYATQSWVTGKGYALQSSLTTVDDRLKAVETFFATDDSDALINKWDEIVTFLNAVEGDTLDDILSTKFDKASFTKSNIQSKLGISSWALASSKPSYSYSEISGRPTHLSDLADDILSGNYLPIDGIADRAKILAGSKTDSNYIVAAGNGFNVMNKNETGRFWFGYGLPSGSKSTFRWVFGTGGGKATQGLGEIHAKSIILGDTSGNFNSPSYTLHIKGNGFVSGQFAHANTSDMRLKQNVRKFKVREYLSTLGGAFLFEYIDEEVERDVFYAGTHVGLIYQNVKKSQLKGMCIEREDGFGALNYFHSDYLGLLGAAAIEHEDRIHTLECQIKALQTELKQLKSA